MLAAGLVWFLGHLAFWLGAMHGGQMTFPDSALGERLPLKSANIAFTRDSSDDCLIQSELEMAAGRPHYSTGLGKFLLQDNGFWT